MKNLILLFAVFVLISYQSNAQNTETDNRNKPQFGLKIGVNLSNVYDSQGDDFSADAKAGFAAGAFLSIPIGKYLGVQPEILFSQKGFKGTGSFLGSDYQFTRTTNYIDVPLLFALKPVKHVTLLAGPQYSYLMKQRDVFEYGTLSSTQEQDFKNDNIRKNTLGFLGGVDFNMNNFVLGARVGWDIQNNNGDGTSTTPRYKNVWYQFTIGFSFL